ncbi:unnamed protein product [Paramecium sonneborni]|uniref:Uncharacterized protein n=1 Tax=Paramecium sonneborni TaxID=65129 RepID=A0A8S1RRI6_9CILI|nr:unnamed protein product [Paramecium sonneborni]
MDCTLYYQHELEVIFKEASTSQDLISLGSFKLVNDEYEYATFKFQNLIEMLKNILMIILNTMKKNRKNNKISHISKLRERRFNFNIEFLKEFKEFYILSQAYRKLNDQHEDQQELQKHRDYILQKIEKIKKTRLKNISIEQNGILLLVKSHTLQNFRKRKEINSYNMIQLLTNILIKQKWLLHSIQIKLIQLQI